jgi:hypothetical protein
MSEPGSEAGEGQTFPQGDVSPQPTPTKPPKHVIGISAPLLIVGVLAALWFTNHLDRLLTKLGAPALTHACVNAGNSFEDALQCLVYKSDQSSSSSRLGLGQSRCTPRLAR